MDVTDRWEVERALRGSGLPALARLVALSLLTRADAASASIPAAFSPSLTTIADDTGMDRASVKRHLNTLESQGWVTRGRALNAAADHQPTSYSLRIPDSRRTESLGAESAMPPGRSVSQGLGAESPEARRTVRPNQTSTRPKPDQKKVPAARSATADPYAQPGFAEFWDAYPRKVAKRAAASAYRAALSRAADPAILVKAAIAYRDDPGRSDRYTKHPATWLNGDCWADEPEARLSPSDQRHARLQALKAEVRTAQNGRTS